MFLLRWSLAIALVMLCAGVVAHAAEPTPEERAKSLQAELKMLRATSERQSQKIAEQQAQIDQLNQRLTELGVASPAATTQPTAEKSSKRVLFMTFGARWAEPEIRKAVADLKPDQMFNVAVPVGTKMEFYAPQFVEASDLNKAKFAKADLPRANPNTYPQITLSRRLEVAVKNRPNVLWLVGHEWENDEDAEMAAIQKVLAGTGTRINTTVAKMGIVSNPKSVRHFIWRLAHDTGGICIDDNGEQIDEPSLPAAIPELPKPKDTKPSILKN